MLRIELRRAITPEEVGECRCALCGVDFRAGALYAWPVTEDRESIEDGGRVCPACVEYFGERNPDHFPTIAEYRRAAESYPAPILASVEEAIRLEQEDLERAYEVYAASNITESTEAPSAYGERAAAARRRVLELAPEQQQHGTRLLRRSDALGIAYAALLEQEWPHEDNKRETLAALAELRDGAKAEFRRFREEMGVPAL